LVVSRMTSVLKFQHRVKYLVIFGNLGERTAPTFRVTKCILLEPNLFTLNVEVSVTPVRETD